MPDALTLTLLTESLAICRLAASDPIPAWAMRGSFFSITRTPDELSVVCAQSALPPDLPAERGWYAFQVEGPLDFGLTGILAGLANCLAQDHISLFAISTFDTDYILVRTIDQARAIQAFTTGGYRVKIESSL